MAVIDIIGIANAKIEWVEVHKKVNDESFSIIEIFPVPKKLGFENDAIGILVNSIKGKNATEASKEIKKIVSILKNDFYFTELYNGRIINDSSINEICYQVFKVR